ncbi:Hypothetical predicted protein [Olea europaea subsp. europaea]|uniref:Uncharacterized protein n=1 Tax=Olea europaea subsp. europaea TaxID=158383 RepID=A0A8S0PL87_OLEEU|nr:Hypothetical predicted protein [Olea europaea subsp. europaea]
MACTSSPKNFHEMPKNRDASLPRLGCVLDMACTPCPQTAYKCLKIGRRPYRGQASPRSGQHTMPKNFPEMPEDQAAFLPPPRNVPFMACTPYPRNCLEMPKNRAVSLTRRGGGLHTVSQKLSRNAWKFDYILAAAQMRPGHYLHAVH